MGAMEPWAILKQFCEVFCACPKHRHPPVVRVTLRFGAFIVSFQGDFMFTLPDDATANAAVAYVDAKGKPAKVDGAPVWSSSDEAILTVVAAADGMSAVVTPVDLGTAQVKIVADADLGAGVTEIITLGDVEVVGGQAVAGNVTFAIA